MKRFLTSRIVAALALLIAVVVVFGVVSRDDQEPRAEYNLGEYLELIDDGEVDTAIIRDRTQQLYGTLIDGTEYQLNFPREFTDELTIALTEATPTVDITIEQQTSSFWSELILRMAPMLILIVLMIFIFTKMRGGGGMFSFGKAKARQFNKDEPHVMFDDVAGADEAVEELSEIRDFLKSPKQFEDLGARIPKGVLLYGPPGTGKTLLARAVAGEAGVPFFSISGSDFVEMFVGVGASRVRDLFEQAKEASPAIIFIDEIDAVGRHRGAGMGGGHDEREQTLNQMLVEMDGFGATTGVILIAATNRPDILDPALLRPGRFDRQIVVDKPDLPGRRQILNVHARGKPLASDVDLDTIARRTPGFTGADLQNLLNEAALLTARDGLSEIQSSHVSAAIDRVIGGPERKSRVMSDHEQRVIAYHESGHALVGHVLQHTDPIHKVSILSRGRALGWTMTLPERDKYLNSRSELRSELAMLLGGRTAEEMVFGDPTTGATDDIARVSKLARQMVTTFGMSEKLGPQAFGRGNDEVFVGKEVGHSDVVSDAIADEIEAEIRDLISVAHREAYEILHHHRHTLDTLAEQLLEHETLDEPALMKILGEAGTWDSDPGRSSRSSSPLASEPFLSPEYRSEEPPPTDT
jgi:cell division protease FtsH